MCAVNWMFQQYGLTSGVSLGLYSDYSCMLTVGLWRCNRKYQLSSWETVAVCPKISVRAILIQAPAFYLWDLENLICFIFFSKRVAIALALIYMKKKKKTLPLSTGQICKSSSQGGHLFRCCILIALFLGFLLFHAVSLANMTNDTKQTCVLNFLLFCS